MADLLSREKEKFFNINEKWGDRRSGLVHVDTELTKIEQTVISLNLGPSASFDQIERYCEDKGDGLKRRHQHCRGGHTDKV